MLTYNPSKKNEKKKRAFLITSEVQRILYRWGGLPNEPGKPIDHIFINKFLKIAFPKRGISCHSGRRSFCKNAYLSGASLLKIRRQSGHGSDKLVELYIQSTGDEALAEEEIRRIAEEELRKV